MIETAIILGFLGSLHCVGMCGPLIGAINSAQPGKWYLQAFYHAGRLSVYAVLGMLAKALGLTASLMDAGQIFSTALGILLMAVALMHFAKPASLPWEKPWGKMVIRFNQFVRSNVRPGNIPSRLLAGAANGILPCGMVYMALAGAVLQPGLTEAGLFMLFFGLGTVPALVFSTRLLAILSKAKRQLPTKSVPIAMAILGLILLLRGLNLGIPYVSPQQPKTEHPITLCH